MSLVKVDQEYRITLTSKLRKAVRVQKGQYVYILSRGDNFVIIPIDEEIDNQLQKLIGNVKFDKAAKKKTQAFLFEQAR